MATWLTEAPRISEEAFRAQVIELAELMGWDLIYHTHDSRRSPPGFPDLALGRERIIWAELKRDDGILTGEQYLWLERLQQTGHEAYLWQPGDWDEIVRVLSRSVNS